MLYLTVENAEVNWKKIKPQGYKIGGKTGTAQVAISGYYDPNKTIASFIGFFPIDKPKIIVLVTLKEPSTSTWGSETAAPVFFSIARQLLIYYNIPPEE
jgi:cell division protein FtsI/penicillin-binding protein 2